jgi:hypothetical protein
MLHINDLFPRFYRLSFFLYSEEPKIVIIFSYKNMLLVILVSQLIKILVDSVLRKVLIFLLSFIGSEFLKYLLREVHFFGRSQVNIN